MKASLLISALLFTALACDDVSEERKITVEDVDIVKLPSVATDSNTTYERLLLPEGFSYTVLFSEGDPVMNKDSIFAPAKNNHDCTVFIPIDSSSEHGWLFVSHETRKRDSILGDGGGGTIFEVALREGKWDVVSDYFNVDYSNVGFTFNNCGGKATPMGTILSAEEATPSSNQEIAPFFSDTNDFRKLPKHKNFGYMVEIDPLQRKAIRKLYKMGRFVHEDAYCMPDSQTVYLTQDDNPAIFWKFIAKNKGDYSDGQLYAFNETDEKHWIPMPMDQQSLLNITNVAIQKGATMYQRHEWVTRVDNKLYITETGRDQFDWRELIQKGGEPGRQFQFVTNGVYKDPYGRVLEYNLMTQEMKSIVNGGLSLRSPVYCFSNPDAITSFTWKEKDLLFICEDIIGLDEKRSSSNEFPINEAYLLDLSVAHPTVDALTRFAIGPKGCETTGAYFTPDGKTLFLSIQHPNPDNPPPFNRSCVVAITGF